MRLVAAPLPQPQAGELLVRTRAGAVSVGTELPLYSGSHRGSGQITYPRMTGYESVGEVIAAGPGVTGWQVGDRLLAFYGHRTGAVLPASRAIPIPENIPDSLALLAILGCDTAKGVNKLWPQPPEKVLVTGAGTIGLLTLFNLKAVGVQAVDVVEPLESRRELAQALGASNAFSPEAAANLEEAYDAGFECSSRQGAFEILQSKLRPAGRICILADGNLEPLTLSPAFHEKELSLVASSDGEDYPGYAAWFFEQARPFAALLAKLYQVVTPHTQLPEIFAQMAQGQLMPVKVLVQYP